MKLTGKNFSFPEKKGFTPSEKQGIYHFKNIIEHEEVMNFFPKCASAFFLASLLWTAPPHAQAEALTVSAASSLTEAFTVLAKEFTSASGIEIQLNFASSNNLLRQMQSGAPVDVFASADQATMDRAADAKLIRPESRRNMAKNTLVLISPAQSRPLVLADLAEAGVTRIAVGTPASVPAGRYAKEALSHAGLWDTLEPKFVYGSNVRQVLAYVQRGEADAGIVYGTDALAMADRVRVEAVLEGHSPVSYPIAVTASAANPDEAGRFLTYVLSKQGQAVLARFGFCGID